MTFQVGDEVVARESFSTYESSSAPKIFRGKVYEVLWASEKYIEVYAAGKNYLVKQCVPVDKFEAREDLSDTVFSIPPQKTRVFHGRIVEDTAMGGWD